MFGYLTFNVYDNEEDVSYILGCQKQSHNKEGMKVGNYLP